MSKILDPLFFWISTSAGDYPIYEELKETETDKVSKILPIANLTIHQYARVLPEPSEGGHDGADGELLRITELVLFSILDQYL